MGVAPDHLRIGKHLYMIEKLKSKLPAPMTSTTQATKEVPTSPYHHDKKNEGAEDAIKLPINKEDKTTILLNVEGAVKDLATALAKKQEIKGVEVEEEITSKLPNSLTGVMVHYFCKGIREDFGISFAEDPISLRQRGSGSAYDKKVASKRRLLTREQKNELLTKTQMSYYEKDISAGTMTLEQAMFALRDAFERKQNFEEMGYVLPAKKTEYPYWVDEVAEI